MPLVYPFRRLIRRVASNGQQDAVAEPPGAFDRFLSERAPCLRWPAKKCAPDSTARALMSSRSSPSWRATSTACSLRCRAVAMSMNQVKAAAVTSAAANSPGPRPRRAARASARAARRPPAPGTAPTSSGRARRPGAAPAWSPVDRRQHAGRRAAGWLDRRPAGPASCPAPARSDKQPPPPRTTRNTRRAPRRPRRTASSPAAGTAARSRRARPPPGSYPPATRAGRHLQHVQVAGPAHRLGGVQAEVPGSLRSRNTGRASSDRSASPPPAAPCKNF